MSKTTTRGLGSAAARNLKFVLVPALLACTSLTGCGSMGQFQQTVSAAPIDLASAGPVPPPDATTMAKLNYLGNVLGNSAMKCSDFVSQLTFDETSTNTTLDILGTVSSALSTAFVPPGTKTALSAAATIATGSKTAIDTDIFDKAAISDFSKAVQHSYSAAVQDYMSKLPAPSNQSDSTLAVSLEVAKIQGIHALCGLAPAEATIDAQLSSTTQGSSQTGSNAGSPTAGFALRLGKPKNVEGQPSPTQPPIWGGAY